MYINPEFTAGVMPLMPQGTNSTMFTECCGCAICDDQATCPRCKRDIIGHDASPGHERGRVRWKYATRLWNRKRR